ncbi:MAG: sodium/glutamate symporter, partial [Candidatus Adiutrix sp.]
NVIGVSLATLLGIHPALGIMAGAVSLEGGHGAVATFGSEVELMGVRGALSVALACATFGLVAGNLTGGPLGRKLITKFNIPVQSADTGMVYDDLVKKNQVDEKVEPREFLTLMAIISIMMVIGVAFAAWIRTLAIPNFFLPSYVGAMFGAIIFRNINDYTHTFKINSKVLGIISDVSIAMFLSMAMMNLKLWDLADLALPIILILVVQVAFLLMMTYFVLFRLLGRDYDAAVMCAGMMGHGLGATPNAVANMNAICERYGVRSNKAFLIVPLCGAVLIDIVAIPCISLFIGFFT